MTTELLNRIYHFAAEDFKGYRPQRYRQIAYYGLVASCRRARIEFRDCWLDNMLIDVRLIDRFASCFLLQHDKKGGLQARPPRVGSLHVWVNPTPETATLEIAGLVKLRILCPTYRVRLRRPAYDSRAVWIPMVGYHTLG